jgi:hypothetical protein
MLQIVGNLPEHLALGAAHAENISRLGAIPILELSIFGHVCHYRASAWPCDNDPVKRCAPFSSRSGFAVPPVCDPVIPSPGYEHPARRPGRSAPAVRSLPAQTFGSDRGDADTNAAGFQPPRVRSPLKALPMPRDVSFFATLHLKTRVRSCPDPGPALSLIDADGKECRAQIGRQERVKPPAPASAK